MWGLLILASLIVIAGMNGLGARPRTPPLQMNDVSVEMGGHPYTMPIKIHNRTNATQTFNAEIHHGGTWDGEQFSLTGEAEIVKGNPTDGYTLVWKGTVSPGETTQIKIDGYSGVKVGTFPATTVDLTIDNGQTRRYSANITITAAKN